MGLFPRNQDRALSDKPQKGGAGCLIAFGACFALFGSIFVVAFFVLPMWHVIEARSWQEVPCTILESHVERAAGKGSTYRVAVRYRYLREMDGAPPGGYESTRYSFATGSSSGRDSKQAVVDRLPPGLRTTCWVDPHEPSEAVLVRGITSGMWFGLISLVFPAVGIAVIVFALRLRRKERLRQDGQLGLSDEVATPAATFPADPLGDTTGPQVLIPAQTRLTKFLQALLFTAFWNGVTWFILGFWLIPAWQRGEAVGFPLILLSVFALIGLGMVGVTIHAALAMTNPRIRVTVNRRSCRPGDTWELSWECLGDARQLQNLCLALEGVEEATYRRGTTTTTDTSVFCRLPVAAADDGRTITSGRAAITIPDDAVPTFTAPNNKLHWRLIVRGEIPRWPDISDDYAVLILPPEGAP